MVEVHSLVWTLTCDLRTWSGTAPRDERQGIWPLIVPDALAGRTGSRKVGEEHMEETPAKDEMLTKEHSAGDTVRDHLANKRTMLAWARTGIAVMALGFVVARFGLLLRELGRALPRRLPEGISTVFGTALVVVGGLLILLATLDYLRSGRAIDRHAYRWSPGLELSLSLMLMLAAVAMAVYLVLTG